MVIFITNYFSENFRKSIINRMSEQVVNLLQKYLSPASRYITKIIQILDIHTLCNHLKSSMEITI